MINGYSYLFNDPLINIQPHYYHDKQLGCLDDYAYRVAVGLRQEKFDLLIASSYRHKGNYFVGTRLRIVTVIRLLMPSKQNLQNFNPKSDPYIPFVANIYHPDKEVPNTSYTIKSLLLKNDWYQADDLTVNFTYRDF
ncbi:MAG: hypothetical protein ACL7BU_10855 [Candidatus Phlomobacter fragariae]